MDETTNDWARAAMRALLTRCMDALETELEYEASLVRVARVRLGV